MEWLNYHHLLYFWIAARDGGVSRAGETLRLASPTISEQIRNLEKSLNVKLFEKRGRNLVLTDAGRVAFDYAEEIFSRGAELIETLAGGKSGRRTRFTIGIADVVPKLIAYRLILPALKLDPPARIVRREGSPEVVVSQLAIHEIDLVISEGLAFDGWDGCRWASGNLGGMRRGIESLAFN